MKALGKSSIFLVIFIIIAAWIFSGWPRILSYAEEATSTSPQPDTSSTILTPETATSSSVTRFDFPIDNIKVLIEDNGQAKIDLSALTFNLPADTGELELYAIQDGCSSANMEDVKRNVLTCPQSRDHIGFALLRPSDYTWTIDRPMRIVIGACKNKDIDCVYQSQDFLIGFISKDLLMPNTQPGQYLVIPQQSNE